MKTSSKSAAVLVQCPGWGREAPPYALACLAAYIRANSRHKVRCLDLNNRMYHASTEKDLWDDKDLYSHWEDGPTVSKLVDSNRELVDGFVREILATGAPVIGFTTHTTSFLFTLAVAKLIKEKAPDRFIVLGGPQCSRAQAAFKFASEPCVDAVVPGEGEEILLGIVDSVMARGRLPRMPGVILNLGKDGPLDCGEGSIAADLDKLPFPDYSDFSADMLADAYGDPGRLEILDSRGCPIKCHFCSEWQFWKKYRSRKGAGIFEEIKHQTRKHPGVWRFYFTGSLLNGNPKELESFCAKMIADGSKITWEGQAIVHPAMTTELARKMAKAGCRKLAIGLESGSKRILRRMNKPFELRTALANLKALSSAGIELQLNFMFGMPGETRRDFALTLKFLLKARRYMDSVLASQSFCVLDKHTGLYDNAVSLGIANREHHLYWTSNRGENNYPERLKRYEEFCRLALFLGLPEMCGVLRKKPDKWLLLGDYYLNSGSPAKALTCFRRSLKTENFKQTAVLRLKNLGHNCLPPPAAAHAPLLNLAAARERNLRRNDEELSARRLVLRSTPRYVTIGAHMSCNANCIFCQKDTLPPFSLATYRNVFERKMASFLTLAEKVAFVGFGELLLMPEIEEFLAHLNRTLPDTGKIITTNGTPLTPRIAGLIIDGFYSIQVSLHASSQPLHSRLTKLANFNEIIKNIENLSRLRASRSGKANLYLSLICVLTLENIDDMPELVKLAARLGVKELRFEYMTIFRPEHIALSCYFQKKRAEEAIARAKMEFRRLRAPDFFVKFPPLLNSEEGVSAPPRRVLSNDIRNVLQPWEHVPARPVLSPVCEDPWRHIYVESQGTVLPCCFWGSHLGDILKQDITDIWNGKPYRDLRRAMAAQKPLPDCSHCVKRAGFKMDGLLSHITARPENRRSVIHELKTLKSETMAECGRDKTE